MKRLVPILLAGILLLFTLAAAVGGEARPARAETAIPVYGCPDVLDGSPVGGGVGYTATVSASQADYVVSTMAALKSALAAATSGQIVYVADGATITLSANTQMYSSGAGIGFYVPAGVTLAGGRGNAGVTPGTIQVASGFRDGDWCYMIRCGSAADVCGLNLYGNQDTTASGYTWTGISCGAGTEVYNNEVHGFGYAGVTALPDITNVWVHHNYIHHCRGIGHGYGVEVDAVTGVLSHDDDFHLASALIEGNIIDYTRHCVANQSGRGSYIFRYNYLGSNAAYEAQCDVHGQNDDPGGSPDTMAIVGGQYVYCAGENVEIYNNTSVCTNANEFVGVRGFPCGTKTILVHHNWLKVTGDPSVIVQWMYRMPGWRYSAIDDEGSVVTGSGYGPFVQMESYSNWYGTSAPPSSNRAPVLNAVGSKTVAEQDTLTFTISASDPDGDSLAYLASNLPAGATFNPATRRFSWTPGYSQDGVYTGIHFQVSDGQLTDSEDIVITVSDTIFPDVNSDGFVNAADITSLERIIGELDSPTSGADANGDGTVNVADITLLERFIGGLT